jgi:ribosomal protein L21E
MGSYEDVNSNMSVAVENLLVGDIIFVTLWPETNGMPAKIISGKVTVVSPTASGSVGVNIDRGDDIDTITLWYERGSYFFIYRYSLKELLSDL